MSEEAGKDAMEGSIEATIKALDAYIKSCTGPEATDSCTDLKLLVLTSQTMNFMQGYIAGLHHTIKTLHKELES